MSRSGGGHLLGHSDDMTGVFVTGEFDFFWLFLIIRVETTFFAAFSILHGSRNPNLAHFQGTVGWRGGAEVSKVVGRSRATRALGPQADHLGKGPLERSHWGAGEAWVRGSRG